MVDWWLGLAMLVGLSLVVASGCVINNYLDQGIDRKMARTRRRALVSGVVTGRTAIVYGAVLGVIGVATLAIFTNRAAALAATLGWFYYVVMYSYWKRRSSFGTVVGSLSGAIPPVVGYVAVTGRLDSGAALLFLILVLWQMPHFYAIAIYRLQDYTAAGLPVLPVERGVPATQRQMLVYIVAFTGAACLLTALGFTGWLYLVAVGLAGLVWLGLGIAGFSSTDPQVWARRMFKFSLLVILVFCLTVSVNPLPR